MTITRTSYPERVLIVLNPDGTLKGAHVERLETLAEDAVVLQVRQLPPEAVDAASLISTLPAQADLLAQVQSLTDAVTAAEKARDAAKKRETELTNTVATLNARLRPETAGGFAILSPVQLRLGLLTAGVRTDAVVGVINAMPDEIQREQAMTYWDYSLSYHRDHPLIVSFAAALNLTSEQVDAMWEVASQY